MTSLSKDFLKPLTPFTQSKPTASQNPRSDGVLTTSGTGCEASQLPQPFKKTIRFMTSTAKVNYCNQPDPFQAALSKLAENRLRVTIDGRLYAARVVAAGEKVPTATEEDYVIAFGDGVIVKRIPIQDYLNNW